uniref:Uncharacterized protein n=1 Tax=Myripristis murdjan TaxID=586833 RepID=A0A667ZD90_9TELE
MFLIIFLVLFPLLSQGEVTTFANCKDFFFKGTSPTIFRNNNRYKQICQCVLDRNRNPWFYYATLYDTENKIPVYSAYLFRHGYDGRQKKWKIEPQYNYYHYVSFCLQLDNVPDQCMKGGIKGIGNNQALNTDYVNSGYDKGHLYPVRHTADKAQMKATFTLTNAAPQDPTFNRGNWSQHEATLRDILKKCRSAFVVTGVVPGTQTIKNRVRVAAYYWSAYCCDNGRTLRSGGFIGPKKGKVESMTVKNLEAMLSDQNHYGSYFSVFHGKC